MKFVIKIYLPLVFSFAITFTCHSQVQEFFVHPSQTNAGYAVQDSHFVARNTGTHLNKLLLFIGGTFSSPKQYDYFCRYAANHGFDAISLCYPNLVLTTLLAGSSDSMAFNKFREEICFGTQVSPMVTVDSLNSIYTRTLHLINYLAATYPADNWNQYLLTPTSLDWSKIIVSGHSQGAGHAPYLAKKFATERVIMFAGPNDYSTYFSNSAPWLRSPGVTDVSRHFAFLHLQDEIVPFNQQFANITGLVMLQGDDTTLVDNNTAPYSNSHCLYSKLAPYTSGQYHNSPVIYSATPRDGGGNPVFAPVWDYMLLNPLTSRIYDVIAEHPGFHIYPNPAASSITLEFEGVAPADIVIFNSLGEIAFSDNAPKQKRQIDISELSAGVYFVRSNGKVVSFVKE